MNDDRSTTVASLPMYDPPEVRALTDAWWQGLARHFRSAGVADVPGTLTRPDELHAHWGSAGLLFSQGCGYPLTHEFAGRWQVIATPCYAAPGCDGPYYRSLLIVREDAPFGRSVARPRRRFNSRESHSGYNIRARRSPLGAAAGSSGAWSDGGYTGRGHGAGGEADVASPTAYARALARHARRLAGTRVLTRAPSPGLPYVTAPRPTRKRCAGCAMACRRIADPALGDLRGDLLSRRPPCCRALMRRLATWSDRPCSRLSDIA
jgi:hypothetical protein